MKCGEGTGCKRACHVERDGIEREQEETPMATDGAQKRKCTTCKHVLRRDNQLEQCWNCRHPGAGKTQKAKKTERSSPSLLLRRDVSQ